MSACDVPAPGHDGREWALVAISYPVDLTAHECASTVAARLPDGVDVEVLRTPTPGRGYLLLSPAAGHNDANVHRLAEHIIASPHHYGLVAAAPTTPLT